MIWERTAWQQVLRTGPFPPERFYQQTKWTTISSPTSRSVWSVQHLLKGSWNVSMFVSGPDRVLSISVRFGHVRWCWRGHTQLVLKNLQLLFCVRTPYPSLVLLSAFTNQRFVSMLGEGLLLPFFSLCCTVEPISLYLSLFLSPHCSVFLWGCPARVWLAAFFLLCSVVYITRARPFWRWLPMASQSCSDALSSLSNR